MSSGPVACGPATEVFPVIGIVAAELAGKGKVIVALGIVPVPPDIAVVGCEYCCCSLWYSSADMSWLVFVTES